jgi:tetratricopeptide (TPR) repeat protein
MRNFIQRIFILVAVLTCVPAFAATATDFYVELLRRGVSEVEAGRHASAVTPLRLAAFGLIDSIEHYQTAQAYLVVALDRLEQTEAAREAAQRILAAERVERKFASLRLPDAIRSAFTTSAKKLLAASDVTLLTAAPPPAPVRTTTTPPQPQTSAKVPQGDATKVVEPKVVEPTSRPVVEKPVPTTTTTTAVPAASSSSTTRRPEDPKTPPRPAPTQPVQPKPAPVKPAIDIPARLVAGERALIAGNLADARKTYRELLDAGGHDHATWIRVAEGLYRSRDFAGALAAFQRVGTLRPGEEAYRYYIAVAYYETAQYDSAKRELAAALPFIELTPDVQRYRAKIENAR